MKANFTTLVGTTSLLTIFGLVGCGGGGTTTAVSLETSLAEQYTAQLVPLPTGASEIVVQAISPDGTKMAGYYTKGGQRIVFRIENGERKDLDASLDSLMPRTINDNGLMVGIKFTANTLQAFYSNGSSHTVIPMPEQAYSASFVGLDQDNNIYHSYQLQDASFKSYKTKNGNQSPVSINGSQNGTLLAVSFSGKLAGMTSSNYYVQSPGGSWTQRMSGMQSVMPISRNDSGVVVGTNKSGQYNYSFIDDGTTHFNCAEPNSSYSVFECISEGGLAVGTDIHPEAGNQVQKAFAWSMSTGYTDLNTRIIGQTNFVAGEGAGVSNNGIIVGWGKKDGAMVGMILTPVKK